MKLFVALLFLSIQYVSFASILTPHGNLSILFGSTVVFNCSGVGDMFHWTRSGSTINEMIKQEYQISIVYHNVSDGVVSSSLYINATIANDRAAIACGIYTMSHSDSLQEQNAILYIIRLSPVRNLSLSIDVIPNITWIIPSAIAPDISVSNIRYTVTLERGNITSTANKIKDMYYQFTNVTVKNCTAYNATVNAYDITQLKSMLYTSDDATTNEESIVNTCKHFTHIILIVY